MPRKSATNGGKNTLPKFVACALTEEDILTIQSHLFDAAGILDYVEKLLESGHKLSCAWDTYNDCALVTVTKPAVKGESEGLALSSRGPDLAAAVTASSYKFHTKLDADLSSGGVEASKQVWG